MTARLDRSANADASAETLASIAYSRVRSDIVNGSLGPGEKLRIESLCHRYEVGASPIREALSRLSADGLVARLDQKGFRVMPADNDDLEELLRTRCLIDDIALREAIKRGDGTWEDKIVLSSHRLKRTPNLASDGSINPEWDRRHKEFHTALVEACGSRWLLRLHDVLFDCTDRYRHLVAKYAPSERDALSEHQALMDAVVNRNADEAVQLLNGHISKTLQSAAEVLGRNKIREVKVRQRRKALPPVRHSGKKKARGAR
jgi:GntR family carbon starvation induced transcriptional regulator